MVQRSIKIFPPARYYRALLTTLFVCRAHPDSHDDSTRDDGSKNIHAAGLRTSRHGFRIPDGDTPAAAAARRAKRRVTIYVALSYAVRCARCLQRENAATLLLPFIKTRVQARRRLPKIAAEGAAGTRDAMRAERCRKKESAMSIRDAHDADYAPFIDMPEWRISSGGSIRVVRMRHRLPILFHARASPHCLHHDHRPSRRSFAQS